MRKRGSTVRNKSDISSADVLLATTSLLQKRGTVSGGGGSAAALLPHGNAAFRPSGGWRSEAVRTAVETALRTSSNRVCADCAAHLTTKSVGHHVVRLDQGLTLALTSGTCWPEVLGSSCVQNAQSSTLISRGPRQCFSRVVTVPVLSRLSTVGLRH